MSIAKIGVMLLGLLLLGGCGVEEHQDLRDWMLEQEKGMRGRIDPLPTVTPYEPLAYEATGSVDPFSPLKAKLEGDRGIDAPALDRQREPLEEFPLETLRLVGIFQDKQRMVAHLLANGKSHQVTVGNYVGQNFGRVVRIVPTRNEERVVVKELVKEPDGRWAERESELLLDSRGAQ